MSERLNKMLFEAAKKYRAAGFSPIPVDDKKRPVAGKFWQEFCDVGMNSDDLDYHFLDNQRIAGVGIACTRYQDKDDGCDVELVCLDFDTKHFEDHDVQAFWEQWRKALQNEGILWLWDKSVRERSVNGGTHAVFYVKHPRHYEDIKDWKKNRIGNRKLSSRRFTDEATDEPVVRTIKMWNERKKAFEDKELGFTCFLETRGHGGQFVTYPTKGYNLIRTNGHIDEDEEKPLQWIWDADCTPYILEWHEWQQFVSVARRLDNAVSAKPVKTNTAPKPQRVLADSEELPGTAYNNRTDIRDLLRSYGWTQVDEGGEKGDGGTWLRPDNGVPPTARQSATLHIRVDGTQFLYVFTSNAVPLQEQESYDCFSLRCTMEFEGDYKACARQLLAEGYGTFGEWHWSHCVPSTGSKWLLDDRGINKVKTTLQGTVTTNICQNVIYISSLADGAADSTVELVWLVNGSERHETVTRYQISDARSIVKLSNSGLGITSNSASDMVQYMADMLAEHEGKIPRANLVAKRGWHRIQDDDVYVLNNNTIIQPTGADHIVRFTGGNPVLSQGIRKRGELSEWIELMQDISDRPDWMFAVACAFFAPIKAKVLPSIGNPIIEIYGKSSQGKTIALQLASGVWGATAERGGGRYYQTWNGTLYSVELMVADYRHMLACVDEASAQAKRDSIAQLIYGFSGGSSRTQGKADGQLRQPVLFDSILFTTSEISLLDSVAQSGTVGRFVSMEAFGTSTYDHAVSIKRRAEAIYGHGGIHFLQMWLDAGEKSIKMWNAYHAKCKTLLEDTDDPIVARAAETIAAVGATMAIINKMFSLGWDVASALLSIVDRLSTSGGAEDSQEAVIPHKRAYDAFVGWLGQNFNAIAEEGNSNVLGVQKTIGRRMLIDGRKGVFVPTSQFHEWCKASNYSPTDLLRYWKGDGLISPQTQARIGGLNVKGRIVWGEYVAEKAAERPQIIEDDEQEDMPVDFSF